MLYFLHDLTYSTHFAPGKIFPSFRSMCLGSRDSSPSCTIISIRLISVVKLIKLTLMLYGQMCCESHYKNTSLDSLLFQTVYTETWLLRILLFFFSPLTLTQWDMDIWRVEMDPSGPVGYWALPWTDDRLGSGEFDGSFGAVGSLSVGHTVLLGEVYKVCNNVKAGVRCPNLWTTSQNNSAFKGRINITQSTCTFK